MVKAQLEQSLKLVDVAKEMVSSDTGVKVANIMADGQKQSAEIGVKPAIWKSPRSHCKWRSSTRNAFKSSVRPTLM